MRCHPRAVAGLVSWLLVGVFTLVFASQVLAQGSAPPPGQGAPPNNNPSIEDRSRRIGEQGLRQVELNSAADSENQERLRAAIKNVKTDFTRIQVLRNDIAGDLVARKPLDYKLVSEQTAEINKRARELKVYMMARASDDQKENEAVALKREEMVGALVNLCKLIDSFTENPALKNTVNAKEVDKAKAERARADKDLLAIIQLSESIRKFAGLQ